MEIDPKTFGAALLVGQYPENLFSPGVQAGQRYLELIARMEPLLEKHQATVGLVNGTPRVVQVADPSLLVMVDGKEMTLRELGDEAMGVVPDVPNQPAGKDARPRAFVKGLQQAMHDAGIEYQPTERRKPDPLSAFHKALEASEKDFEKNNR